MILSHSAILWKLTFQHLYIKWISLILRVRNIIDMLIGKRVSYILRWIFVTLTKSLSLPFLHKHIKLRNGSDLPLIFWTSNFFSLFSMTNLYISNYSFRLFPLHMLIANIKFIQILKLFRVRYRNPLDLINLSDGSDSTDG